MPPTEDLLFNVDEVLFFFRKISMNIKNAEKFRKVPSKAEKMPSKEELLFNMGKVQPVSK